ncbi:MAG: type II toxin-antitoxin system RelE/ParE family toxin [Burkholderiaceae bacterium]
MPHVKLSARANLDLMRLYEFLAQYDAPTADRAIDTIIAALDILEIMPQGCPLVVGRKDLRKLVINFGATGYLAFYSYDPLTDTSTVASILHQKERYSAQTVAR